MTQLNTEFLNWCDERAHPYKIKSRVSTDRLILFVIEFIRGHDANHCDIRDYRGNH